jgi:predicted Zn finger-like uncharacterized protein
MQIACPNCSTTYQIAEAAVGANGRSVRCGRCRTLWRATLTAIAAPAGGAPADDAAAVAAFRAELGAAPAPPVAGDQPAEPPLADLTGPKGQEPMAVEAAAAPADTPPVALADIPIPVEGAPPLAPAAGDGAPTTQVASLDDTGPPDIESVAARRSRNMARKRRSRLRIPLPFAIAAMIAISVGLLSLRKEVVRHAPQMASFYGAIGMPVNLRGLVFSDIKIGSEIHDGVPVLVVEGLIVSTTSKKVDVPRLRFALRNAAGAEVYAWTAQPSQPVLDPFETMPFRSRLASPPAEGHDIQVRFFTRRDAVAALR